MMPSEEKNQSIKNNPELIQMLELLDKDIKTNIKYNRIPYVQKLSRNMEATKETYL